jgi:Uma2 family endonuclease
MAQPATIPPSVFTYKDYVNWPKNERWELIDGIPCNMSPAPNTTHQRMVRELAVALHTALTGSPCELFLAPFDIRLPDKNNAADHLEDEDIITVVQPDLAIICDTKKIDSKGCLGAPDVVIEVLSPSTAYRDETDKLRLYEAQGVKEYWLVNPDGGYIMVYRLHGKEYSKPEYLQKNDTLISQAIKEITLDLAPLFACIQS